MDLKQYIEANWRSLNIVYIFDNYSKEQLREDAEKAIIERIKEISKENPDEGIARWCDDILKDSNKFFRSDAASLYWSTRMGVSTELQEQEFDNENKFTQGKLTQARKRKVLSDLQNMLNDPNGPFPSTSTSTFVYPQQDYVEADNILFGTASPGTIIKNYAQKKLPLFKSLSDREKHIVGLCANGIIDLSDADENSQKMIFTEEEWEAISNKYSYVPKLHKMKELKQSLKDINKSLDSLDIKKAYTQARDLECKHLDTPQEYIYSAYAHILKVYRKRSETLNISNTKSTEYDAFSKLWSEIIEDAFGSKSRHVKWGESIGESTKKEMAHAGITKKIKGYKVDCRVLTLVEGREHDLLNCEAARYTMEQKIIDDKLKLILETRCNLDHLVACCPHANPEKLHMNYLQVCGNKMDVCSLRLVDHGLYINETVGDLSIPISVSEFKVNSVEWFSLLSSLVLNVTKLDTLTREMEVDKRGSFDKFFGNDDAHLYSYNKYAVWLRGYFFPPTNKDDAVIYPKDMYTSPIHFINAIDPNKHKKQKVLPKKTQKKPSHK